MYQVQVLLPLAINHELTYLSNQICVPGQIVVVPFRKGETLGVVIKSVLLEENFELEANNQGKNAASEDNNLNYKGKSKKYTLKHITRLLDFSPLSKKLIDFLNWVANYNMVPKGMVLKMMLSTLLKYYNKEPRKVRERLLQTTEDYLQRDSIVLSEAQQKVADDILRSFSLPDGDNPKVNVINGVTGSGKTEVYLRVAQEVLYSGKQVLILAPEILLTTQLETRFREKVGPLFQWHSDVSPAQKYQIWQGVARGEIRFIVGARSALFLPFADLGLIIIDEEHDGSFKQDEGVIYHARDMAVVLGNILKIPLILSSATPSIETVHNTKLGKYLMHRLYSRYTGVLLPNVVIVDMQHNNKNFSLHPTSIAKIKATIEQKKQVLIFVNRRGYSPIIFCPNCGNKAKCKICSFWLVYHKKNNTMQCHYCGFASQYVKNCSECNDQENGNTILYGAGVERVEEEVSKLFPEAKIATITSDHVKSQKEATSIISNIINQDVDIIIGTQILAKGLNFPNLHLVIVLNANPSYLSADIRVLEKTYQLLYQVIGRAGRDNLQGEVVLQTIEPKSQILRDLALYNQDQFIETELQNRAAAHMPPFSRMAIVTCSGYDELVVQKTMDSLRKTMPENTKSCLVLGPAAAPMLQIRGSYRYRFIVCADLNVNIQKLLAAWIYPTQISAKVTLRIDVDPQYFS